MHDSHARGETKEVARLRDQLRSQGLKVSGNKADLVNRLLGLSGADVKGVGDGDGAESGGSRH